MTEFRPDHIFAALAGAGVNYVAVGGMAVIAHGAIRATDDVDLVPGPERDNLERLVGALTELGAAPHGKPGTPVTVELLARDANMRFDTRAGPVDVLCAAQFRKLFPDLRARAVQAEVDGVEVTVAARNDLILLKAGTGRGRDLLDIGDLLALDDAEP